MLVMSQSNCVPTLYRQSKNLRLDVPNGSTTFNPLLLEID